MPKWTCLPLCVSIVIMLVLPASAQQSLGAISGIVTDSTGAVLGQAKVDILNKGTGLARSATSSSDGSYNFADLPIGAYTVSFACHGFKTEVYSEVLVQANRTTTVRAKLLPGDAEKTVITVTDTPLLNEADNTNGYILGENTIQTIPLGTGSFTQLAVLSPGVNADLLGGSGSDSGLGNQSIWANGQRDSSNSFTLNGMDATNLFNGKSSSQVGENRYVLNTGENFRPGGQIQTNTGVYTAIGQALPTPPPETIEELRVDTSMYDASLGGNSGAHIAQTTKSGTNALHGQLYEYRQTDALNAAPFFFKNDPSIPPDKKVPALHRNVFGGTIGGPIIRDKLFFFTSYQGQRVHDQLTGISFTGVPLELTDARDPASILGVANSVAARQGTTPITTISPAALALLQLKLPNGQYFIPSPTDTNPADASARNQDLVIFGPPSTFYADQFNFNLDYNFGSKDLLSGKFYYQNDPTVSPFGQSSFLLFPQTLRSGAQVFSVTNTNTLTNHLTWQQKLGLVRMRAFARTDQGLTPSQVGINLFGNNRFPGITINTPEPDIAFGTTIGPSSNFANAGLYQNRLEGSTNLNWVHGRHNITFGFSGDYTQLNVINQQNSVALLTFDDFPSFVAGTLNTFGQNSVLLEGSANRYYRANQVGTYAQDKVRLSQNLALTAGLRFDYDGPLSEKYGRLVTFDRNLYKYDAASDTIINDGLIFAGNNKQFHTPGASDSTMKQHQYGFAPRLGLIWNPSFLKNVVVRAGFGMYFDRGEFFTEFSPSAGNGINGPFGVTIQPPFVLPVVAKSGATLDNPFGTTPPPQLAGNPATFQALLPNLAQTKSGNFPVGNNFGPYLFGGYDPYNRLPYTENWTLDVQWQPANHWVATAAYVGNRGLHEILPIPFNQAQIATTTHPVNGEIYSYSLNVTSLETEMTPDGGNVDARVPFIGFSPNSVLYKAAGISSYHSLQLGLTHRMSHGLQFGVSYTWSHSLDEGSGLGLFYNGNNPFQPRTSYASSDFDRTHVLSFNYLYELPKMASARGALDKILNGWEIAGVGIFESGQPYNVYDFSGGLASIYYGPGNDFITNPTVGLAPGFTPQSALTGFNGTNPAQPALNPAAFTIPILQPGDPNFGVPPCDPGSPPMCDNFETNFSNGGRNIFRSAFQARTDLSIIKDTKINERFALRYNLDIFNLTNTPSFDAPNNNVRFSPCFSGVASCGFSFPPVGMVGVVQHTIGSPRFISMALHLRF